MANSSLSAASGSKAGGSQLSEERRERSERASSYDPVFSLGRCAMSRPRDPGISADIPGSPPDNTLIHRFKRQGRASSARQFHQRRGSSTLAEAVQARLNLGVFGGSRLELRQQFAPELGGFSRVGRPCGVKA